MKTSMIIEKDLIIKVRSVMKKKGFTTLTGLVVFLLTKFYNENKEK